MGKIMLGKKCLYESTNDFWTDLWESNGKINQLCVAVEECAELQKELTKIARLKGNTNHLAEEIADVLICIDQLVYHYNLKDKLKIYRKYKLSRLAYSIKKKESYK